MRSSNIAKKRPLSKERTRTIRTAAFLKRIVTKQNTNTAENQPVEWRSQWLLPYRIRPGGREGGASSPAFPFGCARISLTILAYATEIACATNPI